MRYRAFRRLDIPAAQRLSLHAGWPHREEDWAFSLSLGSGYAAEDGDGLAGTLLQWKHDLRFASIGMVLVAARLQRQGVGRRLAELALSDLPDRNVLLNATRAGERLYRQLGFVPYRAIAQHQGVCEWLAPMAPPGGERLRPVGRADFARLARLASAAAGLSRRRVTCQLQDVADAIVLDRDGEPVGFAMVRRFGLGHVIGPVVASSTTRAKVLIAHWIAHRPRAFLRVDVPTETRLGAWLSSVGLPEVDRATGMVRGDPPRPATELRTYALVNQAVG